MLYESELFFSSRMLLGLEPAGANALTRLSTFFGFTTRLAEQRRARLAAALDRVLASLRACGIDDAVVASRDGRACFVDREGTPADIASLGEQANEARIDFDVLHLFVREAHQPEHDTGADPYRGEGTHERPELELAVDVELHRVVPFDGYPLRLKVHGLIRELRSGPEESWDELRERSARYIRRTWPSVSVHGHEHLPEEFRWRVDALATELSQRFASDQFDRADRSAIVVPRTPRQGSLEELPAPLGAGSFASLPGLDDPLRYLFAWPEAHVGLGYEQMLVLDGRGRRMLATGPTRVVATGPNPAGGDMPENTLAPGHAPLHFPVPDLLIFSGHEWDAEVRRERLIPRGGSCEGLEGCAALIAHERRKFECGARGPARPTSLRGGGLGPSGSGGGYPGDLSF